MRIKNADHLLKLFAWLPRLFCTGLVYRTPTTRWNWRWVPRPSSLKNMALLFHPQEAPPDDAGMVLQCACRYLSFKKALVPSLSSLSPLGLFCSSVVPLFVLSFALLAWVAASPVGVKPWVETCYIFHCTLFTFALNLYHTL